MRVLLYDRLRVRYLNIIKHFERLLRGFLLAHILVDYERFAELAFNGEHRVERCHRLLEYNGDLVAADIIHLLLRELGEVCTFK